MSAVNDGGTEGGQNFGFAAQLWTNMRPASTAGPQTSTCRGIAHDRSTAGARNIVFAQKKATYKRAVGEDLRAVSEPRRGLVGHYD